MPESPQTSLGEQDTPGTRGSVPVRGPEASASAAAGTTESFPRRPGRGMCESCGTRLKGRDRVTGTDRPPPASPTAASSLCRWEGLCGTPLSPSPDPEGVRQHPSRLGATRTPPEWVPPLTIMSRLTLPLGSFTRIRQIIAKWKTTPTPLSSKPSQSLRGVVSGPLLSVKTYHGLPN